MNNDFDSPEAVAIVGMAGRFPGADNVQQFWQNMRDGVESIVHFTDDELRAQGVRCTRPALCADPRADSACC